MLILVGFLDNTPFSVCFISFTEHYTCIFLPWIQLSSFQILAAGSRDARAETHRIDMQSGCDDWRWGMDGLPQRGSP